MAVALIVAAGRGERLGTARPKALVTLSGRPMLEWSVDALRAVPSVTRIVIALPPEAVGDAPSGTVAVAGGTVRSESVLRALAAAGSGDDADVVIVHDAARPLATPALFERSLVALRQSGADGVIAALPVADTIKEVGAGGSVVTRTLDRSVLWAVQTPQVFKRAALERALQGASAETLAAATDDAWLIEQAGGVVEVFEGEASNRKITVPADLQFAELVLAERRS
ncbi:MAG: 2-C-methyl-D-erythritol 4-phosphate cytidylyltransferase [Solirubrobacteraceae bacterium]